MTLKNESETHKRRCSEVIPRRQCLAPNTIQYRIATPRAGSMILPLLLGLTGCTEQDRMLTVRCEASPSTYIAIQAGNLGTRSDSLGLLGEPSFKPGTILQLTLPASKRGRGHGNAIYIVRTSEADFLPPRRETWFSKVLSAKFDVEMDDDVRRALQPLNLDWQNILIANTEAWISNAQRVSLRKPLELLNSDSSAVSAIRSGSGDSRFAFVSEASYGATPLLYYPAPPALASNLIVMPNFYLHVNYICLSPEAPAASQPTVAPAPILFIQIPIKYDPIKRIVTKDDTPLDVLNFDFLPVDKVTMQ
jgi:hypothetical protein